MGHDVEIVDNRGRVQDNIYFSRACHSGISWDIWDVALIHGHTGRIVFMITSQALSKLAKLGYRPVISEGKDGWSADMGVFMTKIKQFQQAAKKYPNCRFYSDQVWAITPFSYKSKRWSRKMVWDDGMFKEKFVTPLSLEEKEQERKEREMKQKEEELKGIYHVQDCTYGTLTVEARTKISQSIEQKKETKNPIEGHAKVQEGGLRFGELERDCLIAYGASMKPMAAITITITPIQKFICRLLLKCADNNWRKIEVSKGVWFLCKSNGVLVNSINAFVGQEWSVDESGQFTMDQVVDYLINTLEPELPLYSRLSHPTFY